MHSKYRADIDGLRAIAVLAVIVFHLNPSWLHGGFIGVDIFFVISGYLITRIIFADVTANSFSFKTFYQRRINRILPVFFFTGFITMLAAWFIMLPEDFDFTLKSFKTTVYFWQNMFFAANTGGYFDAAAETLPMLHTWSLAVEEQFYIFLPPLILALHKMGFSVKKVIITLAVIAAVSFTLAQLSPKSMFLAKYNYYSLFTGRAGELMIGSIAGIISLYKRKTFSFLTNNIILSAAMLGIALSYIFISKKTLFPSFITLLPALSAGVIVYFGSTDNYISRFLSLKPLVFTGKMSYSLYLWHWPLIVLAKEYFLITKISTLQAVAFTAVMFALSAFSYFFIETPCRKKKRSFLSSFLLFYLLPALLLTGVYYTHKKTDFLNKIRASGIQEKQKILDLQAGFLLPDSAAKQCFGNIKGDCVFGDVSKKPEILLMGDSHAAHYIPYLDIAGQKYGFSFRAVTSSQCTFIPKQYETITITNPSLVTCQKNIAAHIGEIEDYGIIIMASQWTGTMNGQIVSRPAFLNMLEERIKELKSKNKKVILLAQAPQVWPEHLNSCKKRFLRGLPCATEQILSHFEQKANEQMLQITQKTGAVFLDPIGALNESSRKKWPLYKGVIVNSDFHHINEYATRLWAQEAAANQKDIWQKILHP
ncbi:peptidoglycan/LPS O-acetylase OafA/YrhL [Elusimicrobium simillimum]|uniref:acyltransferase family protein n=1 Tax=Elusimicrobium simillimum TaxID=3143438 RepID=UPI003C7017BF